MTKWIYFFLVVLIGLGAQGEPTIEQEVIREKARHRLYPGGIDEEDLQVQRTLLNPTKKIYAKSIQNEILKEKPRVEEDGG